MNGAGIVVILGMGGLLLSPLFLTFASLFFSVQLNPKNTLGIIHVFTFNR